MTVSTLALTLVGAYLLAVKAVAYVAHKRSEPTQKDFFIASRRLSPVLLIGTILATTVNTLAVTGVPALVYKGGVLYSQMFVIGVIAPLLMWLFGSKIWKYGNEHGLMTQGELFSHYFQSKALLYLCAAIGLASIFPFMAIQLSAIGKVLSTTTSEMISYEVAVIISAISIGAYLYFGGSKAVVWTDILQALCFLLIIISSAVMFTWWSGGYVTGLERLQETIPDKLSFNSTNTPVFIDNVLSWPFAFFLWPQVFQRMFMAQSGEIIKKSVPWSFLFLNLVVLCTMTMGIMGTGMLHGSITDPDQIVAQMYKEFLPIGGAFIVVAVFATGMSTVDSILLTSSSILSRDILPFFSHYKSESEVTAFRTARYSALFFLVLVTCFALSESGRGAMAPLVTLGASFATLFLWPLLGMFVWKEATRTGVVAAMSLGFIAICLAKFSVLGTLLPIGSATIGFLTGAVAFFSISSLTKFSGCQTKRKVASDSYQSPCAPSC